MEVLYQVYQMDICLVHGMVLLGLGFGTDPGKDTVIRLVYAMTTFSRVSNVQMMP